MKKITLEEFFNSKERLAIHCDTENKAKKLLKAFDRLGEKWFVGQSYLELDNWNTYKENTCYTNNNRYEEERFFKINPYKIIEFEDIDLGENIMKKKLRDCSREEIDRYCKKHAYQDCKDCRLRIGEHDCLRVPYVNCKDYLSDKALNIELDIPSPHILDKEEHDYLRAVCKPYKVEYIKKTETGSGNQFIEFLVKSSVYCDLTRSWSMPFFTKDTMYKGMEVDKDYTIEDLELDKEWSND